MRNIYEVLKQISNVLDDNYIEIKEEIPKIEKSLGFKAPEDAWNYVYDRLIVNFIPPKTELDYNVLSIWTTKSIEELKEMEEK